MPIATINPATGETLRTFEALDAPALERKLALAARAFVAHRRTTFAQRAEWMTRAAGLLEGEKEAFGRLMTLEMGKTLQSAIDEAAKCGLACRYYAEHAEELLADEPVETDASRRFVAFLPLGIILAVMPWNFPFWQVLRFAAPALMAGNVGLLKHASNVPQCALAIEDLFRRAGFPQGVFQTLLIESDRVAALIEDQRVAAVTLTGSEGAGRSVGATAGKQIKKSVLELGGSDPFVVMPTAELDAAISTAVTARTINNGQSCIAAKRFIVHDRVADEFERRFTAGMQALRVGDPMDPATQIGPLATAQIVRDLDDQVRRSVAAGARLLTGGHPLERPGNFYPPTVLVGAPPGSPARVEELFGPVATVIRVRDLAEAIAVANETSFGLGSSVWTSDDAERDAFIREIEAGMTFVNAMVASDPRLPFGGVKHSGYGRELSGLGIREFVNIKAVSIGNGGAQSEGTTE
ncbi:MAG: NAD-dependent succinate-semialdehyde dehydrogenase [Gemmatimonadota bacterium]|nr:NAD-dependent succinate-semialdehyde dehydrogenase [Gemmatimonadota bacterium]